MQAQRWDKLQAIPYLARQASQFIDPSMTPGYTAFSVGNEITGQKHLQGDSVTQVTSAQLWTKLLGMQ